MYKSNKTKKTNFQIQLHHTVPFWNINLLLPPRNKIFFLKVVNYQWLVKVNAALKFFFLYNTYLKSLLWAVSAWLPTWYMHAINLTLHTRKNPQEALHHFLAPNRNIKKCLLSSADKKRFFSAQVQRFWGKREPWQKRKKG